MRIAVHHMGRTRPCQVSCFSMYLAIPTPLALRVGPKAPRLSFSRHCLRVPGIQTVKYRRHGFQQRIVIFLKGASPRHDGSESRPFGDWNPADIEVMNEGPQLHEGG